MPFNPQKYYIFLVSIFIGTGLIIWSELPTKENHITTCIFKNVTGYPCEFCGTGRALIFLRYGKVYHSIMSNPLGIMMSVFLSISIVWVVVDLIRKKETYFPAINRKVSPMFIVVIILFVIVNWIWNIYKDI